MSSVEKETSWQRRARTALQIGLASVLLVASAAALLSILVPFVEKLAAKFDENAWLGFWGNVSGGFFSLIGSLIAGFAAVWAVNLQFRNQRREEKRAALAAVGDFKGMFLLLIENEANQFVSLLKALKRNDIVTAASDLSTIGVLVPPFSTALHLHLTRLMPSVAYQMNLLQRAISATDDISVIVSKHHASGQSVDPVADKYAAVLAATCAKSGMMLAHSLSAVAASLELENVYERSVLARYRSALLKTADRCAKEAERFNAMHAAASGIDK